MKVKVKDLEELILRYKKAIGNEFSEYTVCIECVHGYDLEQKQLKDSGWVMHKDHEGWDWIEIADAGNLLDTEKKLFGISANF